MKTAEDAVELSKLMVNIGEILNKSITAVITSMEEPLGRAIGNSLEIIESIINVVSAKLNMNIGNSEMIYAGAMETPIRTLVAMSNGVVTEGLGNALVDLMNEKPGALLKVAGNGILTGINAIKSSKRE